MPAPSFGLDHLVILVDDLDEAAARYARFGFTVAPQMRHPFGTANRLVMFENNFLELVGIVDRADLAGPGLLIDKQLATYGPGAFGIALNAQDMQRDRSTLAARGIEPGQIGEGSRPVPLPDGRQGLARFTTAVIPGPPQLLAILFFAQQHVQEVIWIPEWQRHDNGARGMASIVLSVDEPGSLAAYFERLFGPNTVRANSGAVCAQTPLGTIEIVTPRGAVERYAQTKESPGHICAASIQVESFERVRGVASGAPLVQPDEDRLLIPATYACGVTLEFRHRTVFN